MALFPTLIRQIELPYKPTERLYFKYPYLYGIGMTSWDTYDPMCIVFRTNINTGTTTTVYSGGTVIDLYYTDHGALFIYNDDIYFLATHTYYGEDVLDVVNLTKYEYSTTHTPHAAYTQDTYKAYVVDNLVYFSHNSRSSLGTGSSHLYSLDMDTLEVTTIATGNGILTEGAGYYGSIFGGAKSTTPLPRKSTDYTATGVNIDRQLINSGDEWYSLRNGDFFKIDITTLTETPILSLGGVAPLYEKDSNVLLVANDKILSVYDLTEYKLNFTFAGNDGVIYSELKDKLPISKINLNTVINKITVVITYIDNTTDEIYFELPNIDGYAVGGFSTEPNSKLPIIIQGENIINITKDITFYPVYTPYRPPATQFELNLYNNTAEPNRVDKTNYLTKIGTLYGAFREEASLVNTSVTIQSTEVPTFNYVYIPIFNRYYYVTEITSIRQSLWEISLSVDVLMSYKDAIYACKGFIERNEFTSNPYIVDNKRVVEQGYDVTEYTIANDLFDTEPNFVLQGMELDTWNPSAT